ncbi:MAG: hypothetical protein A3J48_01890 [Candidatus Doudnabacteria bacterium RIFCSPHIGHO2_02_FULL_46_11]|uniref:Uncharacterized protein n=1 Tax=Candidatus Doudnabacteria bacterium RIFCSPHIGHO2_02_FULL_46_11 TaxID=1817832 RepID=A0A1F5P9M8_9BACT|nr:MAG: hypothetical protein A3J48_01890 [Candidatus Doudnabacteria bacterium RIFCSPHIGHO2_02_FULL_46_11]
MWSLIRLRQDFHLRRGFGGQVGGLLLFCIGAKEQQKNRSWKIGAWQFAGRVLSADLPRTGNQQDNAENRSIDRHV